MLKEYYFIVVSKVDEDEIEMGDFYTKKIFETHPTHEEIEETIKKYNGDIARVEKRYKLVSTL